MKIQRMGTQLLYKNPQKSKTFQSPKSYFYIRKDNKATIKSTISTQKNITNYQNISTK